MTDWLRLWHDMPTDPKWRVVARKSGQPLACVIAVFNLMLVSASQNAADRGTLKNWDDENAAAALDMDAEAVTAIREAMQGKVLDGNRLTGWEQRQPKREDGTAAERKAEWKRRKEEERNAAERTVTQRNAPETETETETEEERKETRARPRACLWPPQAFDEFWNLYPHKIGKQAAQKSFARLSSQANAPPWERVMDGLRRYVGKTDDRPWCNPATWLNQGRWDDKPAQANGSNGVQPGSVVAAADRLLERIREFDRGDEAGGGSQPGADPVRLLPQGRGQ